MPSVLRSPRGRDAAVRPSGARRRVGPGGGAGGGGTVSLAFILLGIVRCAGHCYGRTSGGVRKPTRPEHIRTRSDPPERRATSRRDPTAYVPSSAGYTPLTYTPRPM